MRLASIEIEEFRGWVRAQRIDLSSPVIVVYGPNGAGKTSLFDAILWCLTGEIARLGDQHKNEVVSLYGESGLARVHLELRSATGDPVHVIRSTDGERTRLQLETTDGTFHDAEATVGLMRTIWPSGLRSSEASAMGAALCRAVYLQQDDVRRFIESDTDAERFAAVAELVGVGRYTELQHQIERERQTWSGQTNERRQELSSRALWIRQLEVDTKGLSTRRPGLQGWSAWRRSVVALLGDANIPTDPGDPQASESVDSAVRRIDEAVRGHIRSRDRALRLTEELDEALGLAAPSARELSAARSAAARAEKAVARLQRQLTAAESEAAAERNLMVMEGERQQELASMAALALRHLGKRCPVCDQEYDVAKTTRRLTAMSRRERREPSAERREIAVLLARLQSAEANWSTAKAQLRELEILEADRAQLLKSVATNLKRLGINELADSAKANLHDLQTTESKTIERLQRLVIRGEHIALQLAQAAESRRRTELRRSIAVAKVEQSSDRSALAYRDAATELAGRIIDGLRGAADQLVADRIALLGPLLDRIYARIDPHPSFQSVQLVSRMWHGRGRLTARIADEIAAVESDAPQVVLSSSQLNALALSVFLALNLGVRHPPLDVILLDDPLQSLDEVNLLGVVDLLRRYKSRRQIIVSTHDRRFAALLQRKLRPTARDESVASVRLSAWSPQGPSMHQLITSGEESPWRIAAEG